ncbi:hypothetical protein ACLKA6_015454 [Drosophila palustris]
MYSTNLPKKVKRPVQHVEMKNIASNCCDIETLAISWQVAAAVGQAYSDSDSDSELDFTLPHLLAAVLVQQLGQGQKLNGSQWAHVSHRA